MSHLISQSDKIDNISIDQIQHRNQLLQKTDQTWNLKDLKKNKSKEKKDAMLIQENKKSNDFNSPLRSQDKNIFDFQREVLQERESANKSQLANQMPKLDTQ